MKKSLWLLWMALLPLAAVAAELAAEGEMRASRSVENRSSAPALLAGDLEGQLSAVKPELALPLSGEPRRAPQAIRSRALGADYWLNVYDTVVDLDYDRDGFYRRFTLNFQPQTSVGVTDVYAEIYLGYEGGAWDYVTRSSTYRIYADGQNEVVHLTTALDYGYPTGYYDVLIDLREANSGALLVSYGPEREGALGLLPLEDANRDLRSYAGTEFYVAGGGAFGWSALLLAGGLAAMRRARRSVAV